MTSTSQSLLATEPAGSPTAPGARRGPSHPATLGLAAGVLLWFAFPPASWTWLGWVALAPLFLLVGSRRTRRSIYFGAYAGGFAFWLLALNWILCIGSFGPALGWVLMAAVLGLFWPLTLAVIRVAVLGLKLPVTLAAPIVWVGAEYLRGHFLTGFPWYYLAHTQYRVLPLIQVADFAGSLAVSLLLVASSALVADLLTISLLRRTPRGGRPTRGLLLRAGGFGALLLATLAYGGYRLSTSAFTPGPRIALMQSNLMQRAKTGLKALDILAIFENLLARAGKSDPRPDLVVWPETAYPYGFIAVDPSLTPADLTAQIGKLEPGGVAATWLLERDTINRELVGMVARHGMPMMLGATTYAFGPGGPNRYNSAILIPPEADLAGPVQSYHKLHLVPFGEYVPLIATFPWLRVFIPNSDGRVPSLSFGTRPTGFVHGKYRYAAAICFEDTLPHVVGEIVASIPPERTPDVLLNLSNDGWFTTLDDDGRTMHASSEQEMHLAASVFRSVEHRVPLARAANTGISALVDGNGRVVAELPAAREDVLVVTVPLDPRSGAYTAWGDWLGLACLAITIGVLPLAWIRRGPGQAATMHAAAPL